jgi:hypothetical protein
MQVVNGNGVEPTCFVIESQIVGLILNFLLAITLSS